MKWGGAHTKYGNDSARDHPYWTIIPVNKTIICYMFFLQHRGALVKPKMFIPFTIGSHQAGGKQLSCNPLSLVCFVNTLCPLDIEYIYLHSMRPITCPKKHWAASTFRG